MAKLKKKYGDALKGDRGQKGVFDKKDAKALKKYYRKKEGLSKKKAARKAGKAPLSTKLKVDNSFSKQVKGKNSKSQYGDSTKINKGRELTEGFSKGKNIQDAGKKSNFGRYADTIEDAAKEQFKINSREDLMKPKELEVSYKDSEYDTSYRTRLNPEGRLSMNKDGSPLRIAQAPTAPTRFTSISNPRFGQLASKLQSPYSGTSKADLMARGKRRLGR